MHSRSLSTEGYLPISTRKSCKRFYYLCHLGYRLNRKFLALRNQGSGERSGYWPQAWSYFTPNYSVCQIVA
ncbi:MAG: hypothetical protein F6K17_13825 [Okeania sp. SIO3C4]|nr:hypothetical protein [Okeania sp. SIO3C4]